MERNGQFACLISDMYEKNDFWAHIDELRGRVIFLIILLASAAIVFFIFMDEIIKLLQTPVMKYGINLYYRELPEKFYTYCRTSVSCSMFLLIPAAGFQIYGFVMPALVGKERKIFSSMIISAIFLFYAGVLFAWFIMVPFIIDFFVNFASGDGIMPLWGISDYIGIIIMIMIVTGISFELPILLFALLSSGVLSIERAEGLRRYFIVAFFVIAAVVTPPEVISQIIVGLLLYMMFEITLIIVKILRRKKQ